MKGFLLFILSGLFLSCSSREPVNYSSLLQPGVPKKLANYRSQQVQDVNYSLSFNIPDNKQDPITTRQTVRLRLTDNTHPLLFDFTAPAENIASVAVNGRPIPVTVEKQHLVIFPEDLVMGELNLVDINLTAGNLSLNRNDKFLYSLFVPARASSVFPCFDQPDIKSTYKLTLRIPDGWDAVANGEEINRGLTGGKQLIAYEETRPIPTYLFAFAAGNFKRMNKTLNGRSYSMVYREPDSAKVARNAGAIFSWHDKAYSWLEEYTGIAYPFRDYTFFLAPSFQYGGMEHPGAIFYRESSLFLNKSPSRNQELARARLIAHEVAHMWFGNLVTMEWFNDVWLKEVFANFMADKITRDDFPDINLDLQFIAAHYPSAYSTDRTAGTHPIQQELSNLNDAGSLYGSIIYHKAPVVMQHLEKRIGKEAMQQGLKQYLQTYSYSNAVWDDLIAILGEVSGEDLSTWNEQWVKTAGMPHYTARHTGQQVTVKQQGSLAYEQLLTLQYESNGTSDTVLLNMHTADTVLRLDKAPTGINLFGSGYEYGYYEKNAEQLEQLLNNISRENEESRRYKYWTIAWENFLHTNLAPDTLFRALVKSVKEEQNPIILDYTTGCLENLFWRFYANEDAVAAQTEAALWERLQSETKAGLKRTLWNAYQATAKSKPGQARLFSIWERELTIDRLPLSEQDFISLATTLLLYNHPERRAIAQEQLDNISNPDREARFRYLLPALSDDPGIRESFFASLQQPENRENDSWVQSAVGYLHHPLRKEHSRLFILPTLELLKELQETGDIFFPGRVLNNTFRWHDSREAIEVVNNFLENRPSYPQSLRQKILQSTDLMKRTREIKAMYGNEV